MSLLQRALVADNAGPAAQRLYEQSGKALAVLVPLAWLSPQDSAVQVMTDLLIVPAVTVHSHVAMNNIISDYVPVAMRGAARWGMLGATGLAALGLTKLALTGPGLSGSVKRLWATPSK